MLSTWKGLSVLRPTLINDILCMIYSLLTLSSKRGSTWNRVTEVGWLTGREYILRLSTHNLHLASGWAIVAANCTPMSVSVRKTLSLRNSVLAYLLLRSLEAALNSYVHNSYLSNSVDDSKSQAPRKGVQH